MSCLDVLISSATCALLVTTHTFSLICSTLCHSALCFFPFPLYTHSNTHAADGLLCHSLPPLHLHPQIPLWLTARAQRQVEWPLSYLSFSPHHLSSSPPAPLLTGRERKRRQQNQPLPSTNLLAAITHHQVALLYQYRKYSQFVNSRYGQQSLLYTRMGYSTFIWSWVKIAS